MSEWREDEVVLVSAIEHYSYCPRQCALIHIEKVFDENLFTLRGRRAHERADTPEECLEDGIVIHRAVPIWSLHLGLQGKTDVLEFWPDGTVYPVEYKHGPRRDQLHDALQLCAQALCLEEMLDISVHKGAVYHHSSHRRREVEFTDEMRTRTVEIVRQIRQMQMEGELPPPVNDARCPNCSLIDACMPGVLSQMAVIGSQPDIFVPMEEGV